MAAACQNKLDYKIALVEVHNRKRRRCSDLLSRDGNTPAQYMAVTRGAIVWEMLIVTQFVLYSHPGTIGFIPGIRVGEQSQCNKTFPLQ